MPRLKILILSVPLHPQVGGIETSVHLLANELVGLSHKVVVATATPPATKDDFSYTICRRPTAMKLLRLYLEADCVWSQGVALKMMWPSIFIKRPVVITHHLFHSRVSGRTMLRLWMMERAVNVAVSKAVAQTIPGGAQLIHSPYDPKIFYTKAIPRIPDSIIFVGRLVPEKGVSVLIDAISALKEKGKRYELTIVGDGPCDQAFRNQVAERGLDDQVHFEGVVKGAALADLYNRHEVAVVPSLWAEPLGLVALEAIACGCRVIGTREGGLPEAIGNCGEVVANGDVGALALAVERKDIASMSDETTNHIQRQAHLTEFLPGHIASKYTTIFGRAAATSI